MGICFKNVGFRIMMLFCRRLRRRISWRQKGSSGKISRFPKTPFRHQHQCHPKGCSQRRKKTIWYLYSSLLWEFHSDFTGKFKSSQLGHTVETMGWELENSHLGNIFQYFWRAFQIIIIIHHGIRCMLQWWSFFFLPEQSLASKCISLNSLDQHRILGTYAANLIFIKQLLDFLLQMSCRYFSDQHSSLWSRSRNLLRCTTGPDFFLAEGTKSLSWNLR